MWLHAIEGLGIDKRDLENYRAVLVIPALYKRSLIKHYMTLLLQTMGFGHAFVLQDHVAATFGAGLGKSKNVILPTIKDFFHQNANTGA